MQFSEEKISLQELQQLIQVAVALEWLDAHPGNYIKSCNGKIAFIDTEKRAVHTRYFDNEHQKKVAIEQMILKSCYENLFKFDEETKKYLDGNYHFFRNG